MTFASTPTYTKVIKFERRNEKLTLKISRQENKATQLKTAQGQLAWTETKNGEQLV